MAQETFSRFVCTASCPSFVRFLLIHPTSHPEAAADISYPTAERGMDKGVMYHHLSACPLNHRSPPPPSTAVPMYPFSARTFGHVFPLSISIQFLPLLLLLLRGRLAGVSNDSNKSGGGRTSTAVICIPLSPLSSLPDVGP